MSALGDLVRERRKGLGLSQQEVADRMTAAGCKTWRTTVSQLERGITARPDPDTMQALAYVLALAPAALMAAAGYGMGDDFDADLAQLRTLYAEMDATRRRELLVLADALLRAQGAKSG